MKINRYSLFSMAGILMLLLSAYFTTPAHANSCTIAPVMNMSNVADSGVNGNWWGRDAFSMSGTFCATGSPNQYNLTTVRTGSFSTFAGDSPDGTGSVGEGVTGSMTGTAYLVVNGTLKSPLPTNLPPMDLGCTSASCNAVSSYETYLAQLFEPGFTYTFNEDWGTFTYTTCDNSQMWVNAASGNTGDITLKSVSCPQPKERMNCNTAWSVIDGKNVDKSGALRYIRHHKFCRDNWYKGYYWYWASHPELMPGH